MHKQLTRISVGELNRETGPILDRVLRGERFIICRHRRPIATLQPLGCVVQPFEGREYDVAGLPLGDTSTEIAKLTEAQKALLLDGITQGRFVPGRAHTFHGCSYDDLDAGLQDFIERGLASKKRGDATMLTGRGYVLREALLAAADRDDRLFGGPGPSSWKDDLEAEEELEESEGLEAAEGSV